MLAFDWLKMIFGVTDGRGSPGVGIKFGGRRFPDSMILPCLLVRVISPALPEPKKIVDAINELFNSRF